MILKHLLQDKIKGNTMRAVIIYYSKHHGNTKKLVDAIVACENVESIDACQIDNIDLSEYDLIGFASGIYYSNFHKSVLEIAKIFLPKYKKIFLLYTCGMKQNGYTDHIIKIIKDKECKILATYGCAGHSTYGPLKLFGGIAKGHPDHIDIAGAVEIFNLIK